LELLLKTFLILLYETSKYKLSFSLAEYIKQNKGTRVVIYAPTYMRKTNEIIAESNKTSIPYIYEPKENKGHNSVYRQIFKYFPDVKKAFLPNKIRKYSEYISLLKKNIYAFRFLICATPNIIIDFIIRNKLTVLFIKDLLFWTYTYFNKQINAHQILELLNVDVVILPEDNVGRESGVWTSAVKHRGGIPIVVSSAFPVPYKTAALNARNPKNKIQISSEKLFARWFPKWIKTFEGQYLSRLPIPRAVALELNGISSKDPWIVNSSIQNYIVVDSLFMQDQMVRYDVPKEQIKVIGSPVNDIIHDVLCNLNTKREQLYRDLNLDANKYLLVCSLPKNYFKLRPVNGFSDYEELLKFWVGTIRKLTNFNAVFSPHPLIDKSVIKRLEHNGAIISYKWIAELIPLCDLFVVSLSTTMKWARACGKPVLNFDCYCWNKFESRHIYTVHEQKAFVDILERLNQSEYFAKISESAKQNTEYWGTLDGNTMKRYCTFFDNI
jgi:hypothetical protein